MKQEEKQLLLKDLSARLPYEVKVKSSRRRESVTLSLDVMTDFHLECSVKPYLRPMSSMTEEERTEYLNACGNEMDNAFSSPRYGGIDWLNVHHFDYRNLIERGLAIEAPSGMY